MKKFSFLILLSISLFLGASLRAEDSQIWTCAMHSNIRMHEPGKCPICGMTLIPVEQEEERSFFIQTTKVIRRALDKEIRLAGTIDYDETRLIHITAWVSGRIDKMFVDFTGIKVNQGDHMLELYSPELSSAQEELIQARKSLQKLTGSSSTLVKKSTERAAKSAEEKLLLLGLTKAQVEDIAKSGKAKDNVVIYSPASGVVVKRSATEGMYVKEGSRIYSIADLNNLWVYLDAYESDLPWIRYGQKVKFATQALPGTTFEGVVSFISPIVNSDTRTTKVRVNVDNHKGLLKPGLFVKGIIHADVYGQGKVINKELKGKYVGPMHPEIIRDEPDKCSICGMDLVLAEKLGYVTNEDNTELPLVIPASSALITGKRAVVYVKNPDEQTFEARDVVLGPEADNYYVVVKGLKENELVVTNGAFKIDADLQIKGKKSMMNPEGKTK